MIGGGRPGESLAASAAAVLVLNPNSSRAMTDAVVAALRPHLQPGSLLHGWTTEAGPPVIDSRARFEQAARAALPACLEALQTFPAARVVLACFGDPGLEALRHGLPALQVLGLADAAMAQAKADHGPFAILTCGLDWDAMLRERAAQLGHGEHLVGVWALPVNGSAYAADPQRWRPALQVAADEAARRGARALIAGGAVFAGRLPALQTALPLVDAVQAVALRLPRPQAV